MGGLCSHLFSSPGWRWEEKSKKFEFKKELEEEDISLEVSDTVRMRMNSIYPFLKFTVETEEDFQNGRLPTLDCEL